MRTGEELLKMVTNGEPVQFAPGEFERFEQARYKAQAMKTFPIIANLAKAGRWKEFSGRVQAVYEVMPQAFDVFYADMPEEYRRDFVIGCYVNHGDALEQCREALKELPKRGLEELPKEYASKPEIIIYRAGSEAQEEAGNFLSWTIDRKTADFFLNTYIGKHATRLYKAKIKPADVIAYTNERNEKEVLQYRSVYDVETIEEARKEV